MNIFWFRRDLRLEDNVGLTQALQDGSPVLPVFIFDTNIIQKLPNNDARVSFIHQQLQHLNQQLATFGSGVKIVFGDPCTALTNLTKRYKVQKVFTNEDYEPSALKRDQTIKTLLAQHNIEFHAYTDQVIFKPGQILKADGTPYTVYTPFKKMWLKTVASKTIASWPFTHQQNLFQQTFSVPSLASMGFIRSDIKVLPYNLNVVENYHNTRDIPSVDGTSNLSPHLRFGTVGIRQLVEPLLSDDPNNNVFLSELIWREFFMHILWHFPQVVTHNFKPKYNHIPWRNNLEEFEKWKQGQTGYPMVDAGMRQLNQTGYMHNRVRMITAGFLCKHLLIDWRWGEAYFAEKLLDYEQASNNGNWQWAAGTGCDAAPYFRVFNPHTQLDKFDKHRTYVQKWVPEYNTEAYVPEMVEHKFARNRALETYKEGLKKAE